MQPAIQCEQLVKTYPGKPPVEAVRGIDLEVQVGECFGVLGPNGAGKTTTIEILEGLLTPTGGQVQVLGLDWRRQSEAIREQIGITLQDTRFAEKLSVRETITLFRSFYRSGCDPDTLLTQVGLAEKATTWFKHLSGGQKQRLAIAVGLVGDPALLFLDEPTTGLDPGSRRQIWDIVNGYRARGRTVLLTTHYMEEAERLCDRVAIVDRGRIIALGTPRKLIAGMGAAHMIEFTLDETQVQPNSMPDWGALPHVIEATSQAGYHRLSVVRPHLVLPALLQRLAARNLQLASLTTRHASLEDVFVKLTGRNLEEPVRNHE